MTETTPLNTISTTGEPQDGDNGDNTVVIAIVVVVVVLLAAIAAYIGYYRRRNGFWPKPFRRSHSSSVSRNPFGNKSYASRWQKRESTTGDSRMMAHTADLREPIVDNTNNKNVYSITDKISEHLFEASEKASREHKKASDLSTINKGTVLLHNETSRGASKREKQPSIRSHSSNIGIYQDRTLPTTLMMTTESKNQMFAREENDRKRSNSTTLVSSLRDKTPMHIRQSRRLNEKMYKDLRSHSNTGKHRRKNAKTSSRVSSKPSNTSDYVSDVEASTLGRKEWKNTQQIHGQANNQGKRGSGCDSLLQDSSILNNEKMIDIYENELEQALQADNLSVAALRVGYNQHQVITSLVSRLDRKDKEQHFFDDRTESQQNTMRSDVFQSYNKYKSSGDSSGVEGQSSDTESMAESAYAVKIDALKQDKQRRYDSDGTSVLLRTSGRSKTKTRKRCKRSRSDGWDSEPGYKVRNPKRKSSNRHRQRKSSVDILEVRKPAVNYSKDLITTITSEVKPQGESGVKNFTDRKHKTRSSKKLDDLPSYQTASLKSSMGGTIMEMPIYSQATWSGPGTKSTKKTSTKSRKTHQRPQTENSTGQKRVHTRKGNKKHLRPGRKLSIGGGGRYFCEYGSLPVDLSKLPKDLVAKIGGQPDQLLEPIEQLNFDQLCRPLPKLGKPEGELSARHLVAEKLHLPPDHRDREVLSNTYEYEDSGLVMTDL